MSFFKEFWEFINVRKKYWLFPIFLVLILFGVLIILMVYVPIMTFEGMEGILYRPMAITVAAAVFGSLILAFVYVPAISAIIFRKGIKVRKNYLIDNK